MTKREICERLLKIRDYVLDTEHSVIAKNLGDLLLDIAAPEEEDKEAAKKLDKAQKPPAKFAYAECACGGKAYMKWRIREDDTPVAKCVKCGKVLEGERLAISYIDWTDEAPPKNLFAEEDWK